MHRRPGPLIGSVTDQGAGRTAPPAGRTPPAGQIIVAVAILAAVAALLLLWPRGPGTPGDRSAEAGFARDMQAHHAQAVEMAFIIRDKTSDPTMRAIAFDIITTQQQQSGQMAAWLQMWGLPPTGSEPHMAWMERHPGHGTTGATSSAAPASAMPGMATAAQLAQLEASQGRAAERLFLTLMIDHHRGGVLMADAVLTTTQQPQVRRLAAAIASSQRAEIEQMTDLLTRLPATGPPG
jgi:uncharacterized protein (DUF305 family)